jgi:hypothetical protein
MNSLRPHLARVAGWIAWLAFHAIVAPLAHVLAIWPFKLFASVVRRIVIPALRGLARFLGYCAAACGVRPRNRSSTPIHFHHN